MSRSDLKDWYQVLSRHFLTDRYRLYRARSDPLCYISCHTGVFTRKVFMHSYATSAAVINSPLHLFSTPLSFMSVLSRS